MPVKHIIRPGDCIASVSLAHGFAPDTVWNDDANRKLREKRESGYLLVPGDVLIVPDLRRQAVDCATSRLHTFRRRGIPEKLEIRLLDCDEPRASVPYVLVIDGERQEGTTDADGCLHAWIPPTARVGELRVDGDEPVPLKLGHLVPVTEADGVRDRLRNLGFLPAEDDHDEHELTLALLHFQEHHELPASGTADDATRAKLLEIHGS